MDDRLTLVSGDTTEGEGGGEELRRPGGRGEERDRVDGRRGGTLVGQEIAPNAAATLAEAGIYTGDHRARQVDLTMVDNADLVLAMSPWYVAELGRLIGEGSGKVHTLLAYAGGAPHAEEIPDPYGYTMVAYRPSMRQLLECVESLIDRLSEQ